MVNGSNPFNMPIINPDYFSASADATMMEYAHGWLRNFATAKPIGDFLTGELTPGANVTGAALQEAFRKSAGTEYHPLGTCAMLPQEDGGVVDTSLKVYGTANVRVVDSSVIPTHISSHTMGTTYGVAEFGADIIKTENTKDFLNPPVSSSGSSKPTGSTSGAVKPTGTAADASPASSDEGLSTGAKIGIGLGVGLGGAALLGAAVSGPISTVLIPALLLLPPQEREGRRRVDRQGLVRERPAEQPVVQRSVKNPPIPPDSTL
jgi:hypothetical protein